MEPYIGEVRMFAGNFEPLGWAFCSGQLLDIAQYDALFNLIGTTYGGDGQQTFALPDLRGRIPVHTGSAHVLGESFGREEVTLSQQNLPPHSHSMMASTNTASSAVGPNGGALATASGNIYGIGGTTKHLAANAVMVAGSSQPHDNMAPYLCVSFIICLFGIFPSPN